MDLFLDWRLIKPDEAINEAEKYLPPDALPSDRHLLRSITERTNLYINIGAYLGFGLGAFMSFRRNSRRTALFNAVSALRKPIRVVYADGQIGPVPDIPSLRRPNFFSETATSVVYWFSGILIGMAAGNVTALRYNQRMVARNPEVSARISAAYRNLRADELRKEANLLDGEGEKVP